MNAFGVRSFYLGRSLGVPLELLAAKRCLFALRLRRLAPLALRLDCELFVFHLNNQEEEDEEA